MKIVEHKFKGESQLKKRKKTTEIILHCEATPEGKDFTVEQVDKWHRDRGFTMIGYQYCIRRDGTIDRGRPEDTVGAHCTDHNSISVGISYVGGCAATKNANGKYPSKDTRTEEQKQAMYELVEYLMNKYKLTDSAIHCHYEFANKNCPAFKREQFLSEFLEYRNNKNGYCPTCGNKL